MKIRNHLFNKRLFPSTRGGERGVKSREFHRVGAGESSASTITNTNVSFVTPSTTKHGNQKLVATPSKLLLFPCKTE